MVFLYIFTYYKIFDEEVFFSPKFYIFMFAI